MIIYTERVRVRDAGAMRAAALVAQRRTWHLGHFETDPLIPRTRRKRLRELAARGLSPRAVASAREGGAPLISKKENRPLKDRMELWRLLPVCSKNRDQAIQLTGGAAAFFGAANYLNTGHQAASARGTRLALTYISRNFDGNKVVFSILRFWKFPRK